MKDSRLVSDLTRSISWWRRVGSHLGRANYARRVTIKRIAVLGLGKVGHLVAELLAESGLDVTGIDTRATNLAGVRMVVLGRRQ